MTNVQFRLSRHHSNNESKAQAATSGTACHHHRQDCAVWATKWTMTTDETTIRNEMLGYTWVTGEKLCATCTTALKTTFLITVTELTRQNIWIQCTLLSLRVTGILTFRVYLMPRSSSLRTLLLSSMMPQLQACQCWSFITWTAQRL